VLVGELLDESAQKKRKLGSYRGPAPRWQVSPPPVIKAAAQRRRRILQSCWRAQAGGLSTPRSARPDRLPERRALRRRSGMDLGWWASSLEVETQWRSPWEGHLVARRGRGGHSRGSRLVAVLIGGKGVSHAGIGSEEVRSRRPRGTRASAGGGGPVPRRGPAVAAARPYVRAKRARTPARAGPARSIPRIESPSARQAAGKFPKRDLGVGSGDRRVRPGPARTPVIGRPPDKAAVGGPPQPSRCSTRQEGRPIPRRSRRAAQYGGSDDYPPPSANAGASARLAGTREMTPRGTI